MEPETTEMMLGCTLLALVPYIAVAVGDWLVRTVSGR